MADRVTQKMKIHVNNCRGFSNPFYVMWYNSKGGIDFFMFDREQEVGREVSDIETYTPNYGPIETTESTKKIKSRKSEPFINAQAYNLSDDHFQGLQNLTEECLAFYLVDNDVSANKWQEVIVKDSTSRRSNKATQGHSIDFVFELQQRFLPTN
jgi:hypothetical protein